MPRTAAKVTQADIARVLRAVAQAGLKMNVKITPDGTISLEHTEGKSGKVDTRKPVDL